MKSVDHIEQLLDHALEATFPASDPVAVSSAAALAAPPPACSPEPGEIEAADWFTLDRLPQALPSKISISRRLIDAALAELGASR